MPFKSIADLETREDGLVKATTLRELLRRDGCLTLPGVFDGISARVAASIGFDALYMTGYGAVASALGAAVAGTATFTEMLDRVRCIAGAIDVPFIADGDTGYGGLLNVDRTVRGYAAAGASGIQLEDQEFPKKCGHTEFRRVIPAADAIAKIRVAVDARPGRDFLIVARTDLAQSFLLACRIFRRSGPQPDHTRNDPVGRNQWFPVPERQYF